jgi:glyoxylate reductase
MSVIYSNRKRLPLDIEQHYHAKYYPLDELLRVSDVVSLHIPLTDETFHLINKQRLELMKPTAILINTARGAVVDEVVLAAALKERKIHAAGLDVFENEPTILPDLLELDNVVLAPHNGTATVDTRNEMGQLVSQNIIRFFDGRNDITRVN